MRADEDDFPFHSVSHALTRGYEAECHLSYQPVSAFSQYRPEEGGVRLPAEPYWQGATAADRAAEAGKVVGLVRRTLSGPVLFAVEAYYLPNDKAEPRVVFQKHYACCQLIPHVRKGIKSAPADEVLQVVISLWAKLIEEPKEDVAQDANVSRRTIKRLANGTTGYKRAADGLLNDYLDDARRRLGEPMRAYGLIP